MIRLGTSALLAAVVAAGLAGCQSMEAAGLKGDAASVTASTGGSVGSAARPKPGDDDLSLGKQQFLNANYGLAEKHFRAAVEQAPDSLEPVVALAAAYDQLGRFDLADRAYAEAIRLGGETSAVLNNRGYSYYLRRDFKRARVDFQAALRKDPANEMARRNLALLGR